MEKINGISEKYSKYNPLIGAKYKSSLLEQKLMAIALASSDRIHKENGYLVQEFRGSELKRLLGVRGHAFYTQLDQAANQMKSRSIGVRDPEKEKFRYLNLITTVEYNEGVFRIEWNNHLEDWLFALKSNFTVLNLDMTLKFRSVYGFRLYEVLRSKCFPKEKFESGEEFSVNYSLSELKLTLGVINAELDTVQRILNNTDHPDYDKAVNASPEKVLSSWKNLKNRAIEPAVKEINSLTDMEIRYEAHGSGQGGKIRDITFFMKKSEAVESNQKPDVDKDDVIEETMDLAGLRLKDARSVCEAAEYDIDKIRKAVELSKHMSSIHNFTGFLINAVKEGFVGSEDGYAAEEPAEAGDEGEFFLKVV